MTELSTSYENEFELPVRASLIRKASFYFDASQSRD